MNFKEMRRKERKLSDDMTISLLKNATYGILSLASEQNGYPYGVALNYVYKDNALWFHCAKEGQKLDIIRQNEKVCFTAVLESEVDSENLSTKFKSVVAFGRAKILEDEEKMTGLLIIAEHFSSDFPDRIKEEMKMHADKTLIIKVEIVHITGKASSRG